MVLQKINSNEILFDLVVTLVKQQAFRLLCQRMLDIERKVSLSLANRTCSPIANGIVPVYGDPALYLFHLKSPQVHRASVLARFNILPSAIL